MIKKLVSLWLFFVLCFSFVVKSQDSVVAAIAGKNLFLFDGQSGNYSGAGWDSLKSAIIKSNNVLIGEDHFMNEVPPFVAAVSRIGHFDNFFCEVDPYTVGYMTDNIRKTTAAQLNAFNTNFRDGFSFYSKKLEYKMFYDLAKSGINMIGTEQVSLFSDRLLFEEMRKLNPNPVAKKLYREMGDSSKKYVDGFAKNRANGFYIMADGYGAKLAQLESLATSKREKEILKQVALSRRIYLEQSHLLRIQLMKQQLLGHSKALLTQRNLFKYGANHMCRGESYLRIYDLGNLVSNFSDSRFERSLHIMIIGKDGTQGAGIPGIAAEKLEYEKGGLEFLMPFFKLVDGQKYHCYKLAPIRSEVERGKLLITDKQLLRTILGYDWLVIIPEVTAAENF